MLQIAVDVEQQATRIFFATFLPNAVGHLAADLSIHLTIHSSAYCSPVMTVCFQFQAAATGLCAYHGNNKSRNDDIAAGYLALRNCDIALVFGCFAASKSAYFWCSPNLQIKPLILGIHAIFTVNVDRRKLSEFKSR